ncbi:E3 ubiquitin-protein ligase TRIM65-like [Palaemon carinicauda]|uniref:E3 ubiquitin-protein ligase TRIM65-like n=1 Tax=Palaemon carinicauda TaxID=392227 RepID=UPI0035B5822D
MDSPEDLQCCVCIQIYSDRAPPKNLPCGHSVCSSCAEKLLRENRECPECRKQLKYRTADDLSTNIPLLRLCRLHKFITCESEDLPPVSLDIKIPDLKPLASEGTCSTHGHPLFFFCLPCDVVVCRGCLISDHPDQPYGRCIIRSIEEKRQKEVKSHVNFLDKHLVQSKNMRKKLEKLVKASKTAVEYWEKRPESKRDEVHEKNLQEARDFHDVVTKELDAIIYWNDLFSEATNSLKAATTLSCIHSEAENVRKKLPEFEKLEVKDRKEDMVKILSKFWNGKKMPFS